MQRSVRKNRMDHCVPIEPCVDDESFYFVKNDVPAMADDDMRISIYVHKYIVMHSCVYFPVWNGIH